ncbi:MAG: hypothetical protein F4X58_12780 [Chloroflexi bacterium]|nr:hypothetical protein [Chloroflexota bacterium]MYC02785.1 hypothetical protein [Chloroflexota bacterium]
MPKRRPRRKDPQQAKNKAKRARQEHRKGQKVLTGDDLLRVEEWVERIRGSAHQAVSCYEAMKATDLSTATAHLRTALIKYVENVGESVKQLDDLTNGELLRILVEIPLDDQQPKGVLTKKTGTPSPPAKPSTFTWRNIKGIRTFLAHEYWDVKDQILFEAMEDVPELLTLFNCIQIDTQVHNVEASKRAEVFTSTAKMLEAVEQSHRPGMPLVAGDSWILLMYDVNWGWDHIRIPVDEDGMTRSVVVGNAWSTMSKKRMSLSLYGLR